MKKWTVVIEISDDRNDDMGNTEKFLNQEQISDLVMRDCPAGITYRVMETIEAPYGPQHPDGVFIADSSRKGNFRQ